MQEIKTVGLIGVGVISSGWAVRCMAKGVDVIAASPRQASENKLMSAIENAWPAMQKLGLAGGVRRGRVRFTTDLEEVCTQADFIQESAPEREDLKKALYAQIDALAKPEVVIASSSSGLLPSRIQAECRHPQRIVIGHPFNPVYLLPLVEILGGNDTEEWAIEHATAFYQFLDMHPLRVRQEIVGYISNRLQEAVWREALHLVDEGVATTQEIDDAVIYGPGLRWAFMGPCLTFHLAGGDNGMDHMLEQFGPTLKLPWTKLQAPELTDELRGRMVEGTRQQAEGQTVKELERLRNDCLVGILQTLRQYNYAAGKLLSSARDEESNA